jgi:hypothetical protein
LEEKSTWNGGRLKMCEEEMDAELFNYLYGTGKDADGMKRDTKEG